MHGMGASIAALTAKTVEEKKKKAEAEAAEAAEAAKPVPLVVVDLDADKATVASDAPKAETDKP